MDTEYSQIEREVNALKLENGEQFQYRNRDYAIWITPKKEIGDSPPCFWQRSDITNGWDIYLIQEIRDKFKRAVILHEAVEARTCEELGDYRKAHEIARQQDRKYASIHFDKSELSEYSELEKELGEFFGN